MKKRPVEPTPRTATARQAIRDLLGGGAYTTHELAREVRIRERDVEEHLEHLAKSLAREGARLRIEPAECLACGYRFEDRRRLTRPGACPACRSQRVSPPVFQVERLEP